MTPQPSTCIPAGGIGALKAAACIVTSSWGLRPSHAETRLPIAPVCGKLYEYRTHTRDCSLHGRWFSTRRKTAKAIRDLHLQQDARRLSLRLQGEIERGLLPLGTDRSSIQPKYCSDPLALIPSPSPPALFDRIHLSSSAITRRSLPPELLHGPPRRPVGRVFSLKSSELAAAVLTCARSHRDNLGLWDELNAACVRRGPHLGAAEAAAVLHGYAIARLRVLPVLQCCAETLLTKWNDVRLVDAARALHSLLAVFRVRETRILRNCIGSFGPLLRQRGREGLDGISPEECRQRLHTLALLLKAFAAVQLPYQPLLSTAAEALRVQLQLALPGRSETCQFSKTYSFGSGQADRIFALTAIVGPRRSLEGSSRGGQTGDALPPVVVVSILDSLTALGVRNEPLFHAFDAFLAATLPEKERTAARIAAPAVCVGSLIHASRPSADLAAEAAAYWDAPTYAYSMRKALSSSNSLTSQSGWLKSCPAGHAGRAKDEATTAAKGKQAELAAGLAPTVPNNTWSLHHLSRAMKCLGMVGHTGPQLTAGWVAAVRHCAHRCSAEDLVLTLEAARVTSFFCRPIMLQVLRCFAHRAADTSLPLDLVTLLSAAISAAQLPITVPAFWSVVHTNILRLSPQRAETATPSPPGFRGCEQLRSLSDSSSRLPPGAGASAAYCAPSGTTAGHWMNLPPGTNEAAVTGLRGSQLKPQEALNMTHAVAMVEAVALASPALPLEHLAPVLPALRTLGRQAMPLSVCLRVSGMIELLRLKAHVSSPVSALPCTASRTGSSGSSADLAATTQVGAALWRSVSLRVESLLKRQQAETLFRDRETAARDSRAESSWMGLVTGPLAPDWHLRELCVYAVLSQIASRGDSAAEDLEAARKAAFTRKDGGAGPVAANVSAREVLRHVRRLIMARTSKCPIVFGCIEEAVALLHFELLPYCDDVGHAVAATRLLQTCAAEIPQHEQGNLPGCGPAQRQTRLEMLSREAPEDEPGNSIDSSGDLNRIRCTSPQPQRNQECLETWPLDAEALMTILSCFSSRLVTASTSTLFHAGCVTLRALIHPRLQDLLGEGRCPLDELRGCSPEVLAGPVPTRVAQDVGMHHSIPVVGGHRTPAAVDPTLQDKVPKEDTERREEGIAQLISEICLMILDMLERRIPLMQANQLALLACDVQALLSTFAPLTEAPPTEKRVPPCAYKGESQRCDKQQLGRESSLQQADKSQLDLDSSAERSTYTAWQLQGEASSMQRLIRGLSLFLEAVACRWRDVPTTILSTGPASALNVCLRLQGGDQWLSAAGQSVQRDPPNVFSSNASTGGISVSAEAKEAVRLKALIETLCPGVSNPEALRWLRRMGTATPPRAAARYRAAFPVVSGMSSACASITNPYIWSSKRILLGDANAENKQCRASDGLVSDNSPGGVVAGSSQADGIDMPHCLMALSAMHWVDQEPASTRDWCPEARGLLLLPRHHDLALMWLSQVMRSCI